jgi:hypothetical protein
MRSTTTGADAPERDGRMEALREAAGEARAAELDEHTVTVEVAADWQGDEPLADLLVALDAHHELLGAAVGADVRQRVIAVTVTVRAKTEKVAQEIATRALADELRGLGLA